MVLPAPIAPVFGSALFVAIAIDYVDRGISNSNHHPALQGGRTLSEPRVVFCLGTTF